MARKAGRPPGAQNKVGKEQKEFIKGLLGDTQQQFRDAFTYYAETSVSNAENREKFVALTIELSKMVVPKPVDLDLSVDTSEFEALLGLCTKWDDEKD